VALPDTQHYITHQKQQMSEKGEITQQYNDTLAMPCYVKSSFLIFVVFDV